MVTAGNTKIAIVIYSSGRPDGDTFKWFDVPNVYLAIPESQVNDYKTVNLIKLPHPDNINRLYLKIDWVWEHFRNLADVCVKIDDDISFVRDMGAYYIADKDIERFGKLDGEEFVEVIKNMSVMSKDMGAHIFGFGNVGNYMMYSAHMRFRFSKGFDASFMGYVYEDKIKVDHSIKVKNEYDLQLQSLFHYGKNLIDNRYRQVQWEMFKNPKGGMAVYRNLM